MIHNLLDNGKDKIKVRLSVPVRVADIGGWIDTWFAHYGSVLNLSVWCKEYGTKKDFQGVGMEAKFSKSKSKKGKLVLHTPDIPGNNKQYFVEDQKDWDKTDLLQAAISVMGIPKKINSEIIIKSAVPPGASTGTSASVSVGIVALLEYATRGEIDPKWLARTTHEVETKHMGIECGVQDQVAAAFATGIQYTDIYRYPLTRISEVELSEKTREKFENKLLTIVYGKPHSSGEIHKMVIEKILSGKMNHLLEDFRPIPPRARFNLINKDFKAYGKDMISNTECIRAMHPKLISEEADKIIEIAKKNKVLGWKVNGAAGPDGGSMTLLLSNDGAKEKFAAEIKKEKLAKNIFEHKLAKGGLKPEII